MFPTSLACFDARRTCGAALDASGGSAHECLDEKKTWPCQMCILKTLSSLCSHFSLFIEDAKSEKKRTIGFAFWNLGVTLPQDAELGASAKSVHGDGE